MATSNQGFLTPQILINHIAKAEEKTLKVAGQRALFMSSGRYTKRRLANYNPPHPYRRALGGVKVPYGDPARINAQTGNFYMSWNWRGPSYSGGALISVLYNSAPYADKLANGRLNKNQTIDRPLIKRIMPNVKYWRERHLVRAIRDAIQQM